MMCFIWQKYIFFSVLRSKAVSLQPLLTFYYLCRMNILLICLLAAAVAVIVVLLLRAGKLRAELAASQVRVEALQGRIEADKQSLEQQQIAFRAEFRNLANSIFEEKATQFKQVNRESLEQLLRPLGDRIVEFKSRVEAIYSSENSQRGELKAEIKHLVEQTNRITAETTHLTRALRGDSKTQGDWGEVILQRLLESSGLQQGTHFTIQENLKDAAGNNLRPDVILRLPEGNHMIIDSKVSLTAFVNYTAAEDDATRKTCLAEHQQSVRNHFRALGAKGYQNLVESPDFVIMFVPNEPAFLAAIQSDGSLWGEAYDKKVIIASPTTLLSILKIVHDLWKREDQSRNALQIAEAGANLYDKLVGLAETLLEVGRNIGRTQESYDKAIGQLRDGKGSVVSYSERLRKLGVKADKSLPAGLAPKQTAAGFFSAASVVVFLVSSAIAYASRVI